MYQLIETRKIYTPKNRFCSTLSSIDKSSIKLLGCSPVPTIPSVLLPPLARARVAPLTPSFLLYACPSPLCFVLYICRGKGGHEGASRIAVYTCVRSTACPPFPSSPLLLLRLLYTLTFTRCLWPPLARAIAPYSPHGGSFLLLVGASSPFLLARSSRRSAWPCLPRPPG